MSLGITHQHGLFVEVREERHSIRVGGDRVLSGHLIGGRVGGENPSATIEVELHRADVSRRELVSPPDVAHR